MNMNGRNLSACTACQIYHATITEQWQPLSTSPTLLTACEVGRVVDCCRLEAIGVLKIRAANQHRPFATRTQKISSRQIWRVDFYCRFLPAKLTSRFLLPISISSTYISTSSTFHPCQIDRLLHTYRFVHTVNRTTVIISPTTQQQ